MVLDLHGNFYSSPFTSSTHAANQRALSTEGFSYCATLTRQAHRHSNGSPWEYQCRSCLWIESAPTTATGHGSRSPAQSSPFTLRFNQNQHCNLGQVSPLSLFSSRMLDPESGPAVCPSLPMLLTLHDGNLSCCIHQLGLTASGSASGLEECVRNSVLHAACAGAQPLPHEEKVDKVEGGAEVKPNQELVLLLGVSEGRVEGYEAH